MTFKDLKLQLSKVRTNQDNRLDTLRDKPLWISDEIKIVVLMT